MKKFNKTLVAAALMVAAGSANATISVNNNDSELYMSVYDSSSKNTFSYDLGLKLSDLLANVSNASYSYAHDFSLDSNWTSSFLGAAGFNAATTVYGLVVGSNINPDLMMTSSAVGGLPLADNDSAVNAMVTGIKGHAGEINSGIALVNDSKVVNDGGVAGTGQFNNFNTVFGNQNTASIAAAYGSSVAFFHESTAYDSASDSQMPWLEKFAGEWKLAGNNLTYGAAPVSAVPLPAAVWMFGAGLMGMLRLNRRKSMAI